MRDECGGGMSRDVLFALKDAMYDCVDWAVWHNVGGIACVYADSLVEEAVSAVTTAVLNADGCDVGDAVPTDWESWGNEAWKRGRD